MAPSVLNIFTEVILPCLTGSAFQEHPSWCLCRELLGQQVAQKSWGAADLPSPCWGTPEGLAYIELLPETMDR
jgi:hypothetical protein